MEKYYKNAEEIIDDKPRGMYIVFLIYLYESRGRKDFWINR